MCFSISHCTKTLLWKNDYHFNNDINSETDLPSKCQWNNRISLPNGAFTSKTDYKNNQDAIKNRKYQSLHGVQTFHRRQHLKPNNAAADWWQTPAELPPTRDRGHKSAHSDDAGPPAEGRVLRHRGERRQDEVKACATRPW